MIGLTEVRGWRHCLASLVLALRLGCRQQQGWTRARGCQRGGVRLDVLAQVVGTHEGLVAYLASELFLARVDAHMPVKLVGTGELLETGGVLAHERFLARVPPQMRFQVTRFPVLLPTAGMMAHMHQPLALNGDLLVLLVVTIRSAQ